MNDVAEESYWRFDARRKGYGEWKETPQSERDAFKAELQAALAAEREKVAEVMAELGKNFERTQKAAELAQQFAARAEAAEARERALLDAMRRIRPLVVAAYEYDPHTSSDDALAIIDAAIAEQQTAEGTAVCEWREVKNAGATAYQDPNGSYHISLPKFCGDCGRRVEVV